MSIFRPLFFVLFMAVLFIACEDDQDNLSEDEQIQNFLEANDLTEKAVKTESGLYYIIDEPGDNGSPNLNSVLVIHYRGTLLEDGFIFDSSYDTGQPAQIPLANTIEGWKEGIPLFERGGKGMLIIPSALAYGSRGNGDIPGDAVLVFEIHLIDFV